MTEDYTDALVQRALAEDDAIAELGIDVVDQDDCLVLSGHVESEQRRDDVRRRVAELCPDRRIVNEIVVVAAAGPVEPEEIS